jgi:sec-independent protein translocase protein TatC
MSTDARMSFREHLLELRTRLRNAIIALVVCTFLTFYFSDVLLVLLAKPLIAAHERAGLGTPSLNFGSLIEPFWVYFKLSMYAAVFVASPFIFHQLWSFIAPGLYDKEKRVALPFAVFSGLFFVGGALFCYQFVFPAAFDFFLSYSSANLATIKKSLGFANVDITVADPLVVKPTLFMESYLDLTTKMLIAFGAIFELPLLIFFLSYVGLVTHRSLWKFNKYAVVISFVVGAMLTPGPDVISQMLMAAPMIVLYNLSIIVAWLVARSREASDKADPPPDDGAPPDDDGAAKPA